MMPEQNPQTFTTLKQLEQRFKTQKGTTQLVGYFPVEKYQSMFLAIMLNCDFEKQQYLLDLEWMCLGLDAYGDTLQESYVYQFESFDALLAYLASTYKIQVTDIPIKYNSANANHPNPWSNMAQKAEFEKEWEQFQQEFTAGKYLDKGQKVTYTSKV
ncbi:MAG: hypothetical protein KDC92_13590 [Bacteroidetes bacterium]|nr:hypothetical protein [Bacteroidota bacterium]